MKERALSYGLLALGLSSLVLGLRPRHSAAAPLLLAWPKPHIELPPPPPLPRFVDALDVTKFQRGNVHTHSTFSDGDSPPQVVYAWYRDHGYQFIALSDHNVRTDPATFRALERKGKFVLLPGEEITMIGGGKQVHVNAICEARTIGGHHASTPAEALSWAVERVHEQGATALVNHPNWDWALKAEDLDGGKGAELLEVWSGHPFVHQEGDAEHKSHEEIWQQALDAGFDFAPAGVDDAHLFKPSVPEKSPQPGRAWIEVFADEPRKDLLCDAIKQRRLFASYGPKLARIRLTPEAFVVWPANQRAVVEFIGPGGVVLKTSGVTGDEGARYEPKIGDTLVRARITDPNGKKAWTPAYRLVLPAP